MEARTEAETEEQVTLNEARLIGDDRVVKVYIKIRDARARLSKAYDAEDKLLKEQLSIVTAELLKRLNERGATQTKTEFGTAFVGEDMQVSIADEDAFRSFVLEQQDLNWYQRRVKVEHLREYMGVNGGRLPPGLNVFRERTISVRAPTKSSNKQAVGVEDFSDTNAAAAAQQE